MDKNRKFDESDERCRIEERRKPKPKAPMVEMGMGLSLQLKEQAVANDLSMFEALVGKKVILKIRDSYEAVVGTVTKNGDGFIGLEDVAVTVFRGGFEGTLRNIDQHIEDDTPVGDEVEFIGSIVLNKSEIGRVAAVENLPSKKED